MRYAMRVLLNGERLHVMAYQTKFIGSLYRFYSFQEMANVRCPNIGGIRW